MGLRTRIPQAGRGTSRKKREHRLSRKAREKMQRGERLTVRPLNSQDIFTSLLWVEKRTMQRRIAPKLRKAVLFFLAEEYKAGRTDHPTRARHLVGNAEELQTLKLLQIGVLRTLRQDLSPKRQYARREVVLETNDGEETEIEGYSISSDAEEWNDLWMELPDGEFSLNELLTVAWLYNHVPRYWHQDARPMQPERYGELRELILEPYKYGIAEAPLDPLELHDEYEEWSKRPLTRPLPTTTPKRAREALDELVG